METIPDLMWFAKTSFIFALSPGVSISFRKRIQKFTKCRGSGSDIDSINRVKLA